MKLSKFIMKMENIAKDGKHPNTTQLIPSLKIVLKNKGDIEIDLDHMSKALGIEF